MVHSVCLRRYDISDHIQVDMKQVELVPYARAAALNIFCKQSGSRSSGSRESCLVMVHYVAYGNMKCLIIHKWNLYARVAALDFLFAAFEAANFQIEFFGNPVMRTAE